jgi:hypothetical protein
MALDRGVGLAAFSRRRRHRHSREGGNPGFPHLLRAESKLVAEIIFLVIPEKPGIQVRNK